MFLELSEYSGREAYYNDLYYLSCYHLLQGINQASWYAVTIRTGADKVGGLFLGRHNDSLG